MRESIFGGAALALAAACVLLSRLRFVPSQSVVAWKTNLVAAEYGHWLAILAFALAVATYALICARVPRLAASGLFALAGLFFLQPLWQMIRLAPGWALGLSAAFGPRAGAAFRPSPLEIWRLRSPAPAPARTFVYGHNQTLRVYPSAPGAPWVLVVHGGGWNSGDLDQLPELNTELVRDGVAVVTVDYRLAPEWRWPAALEDIDLAIEFVRARAAEFGLDRDRWAILGRSAGGQIAAAAGYRARAHPPRGVIAFYAPTDMEFGYETGREDDLLRSRALLRDYLGGAPAEAAENYRSASPIALATESAPPTLLLHGPRDPLVSVRHSRRLQGRLRELGVGSLLLEIPWATHGFDYNLFGPGGRVGYHAVRAFLAGIFSVGVRDDRGRR